MNLTLHNFGMIQEGTINLDKLTYVSSANNQGKTTITRALEFIAQNLPIGFKKKDAPFFVNDMLPGQKRTFVNLSDENENQINVKIPTLDKTIEGNIDFNIDEYSLNALVMDLSEKDRFAYFQELLKTMPTEKELSEKLKDELRDYPKEIKNDLSSILKLVKANGYDSTLSHYKDQKSTQRLRFEDKTGTRYGKDKSPKWQPDHWSLALDNTSKKALEDTKVKAQNAYDDANGAEAVDTDLYNRNAEKANNAIKYENALAGLEEELKSLEKEKSNLEEVDRPKTLEQPKLGYACPCCSEMLLLDGDRLIKYDGSSVISEETKNTYEQQERDYQDYKTELSELERNINTLYGRISVGKERVKECYDAKKFIEENEIEENKFSQSEIDKAFEELQTADNNLKSYQLKKDADECCRMITYYDTIINVLSPDGIRKDTAKKGLGMINKILSKFPDDIECHDDFSLTLDGRDYRILSKSERWRVDSSLKIINAILKKHSLVVLDEFDILVNENKKKWIKHMMRTKVNILVLSSENKPIKMPNSYYIEDGFINKVK